MRGTPPALQITAENLSLGDVARSKSGELSKDGHRQLMILIIIDILFKLIL